MRQNIGAALGAVLSLAILSGCGGTSQTYPGNPTTVQPQSAVRAPALPSQIVDEDAFANAACKAPPPDPNKAGVTLTGNAQTIALPCFKDFRAHANIPPNSGAGVTLTLKSSTDKTLGAPPDQKAGTPILYTSFEASQNVTVSSGTLSVAVASPSKIHAGDLYAVDVFVFRQMVGPTITNIKPNAKGIIHVTISLMNGGTIPGGVPAQIVLYRQK